MLHLLTDRRAFFVYRVMLTTRVGLGPVEVLLSLHTFTNHHSLDLVASSLTANRRTDDIGNAWTGEHDTDLHFRRNALGLVLALNIAVKDSARDIVT
ncbi:hypothetical protein GN958_ATG17673 [Phytophthora infestans]|uniref:Uncharacterized protein n=1 Tax=Phytophthora infestans TaxID=4787 RepID=A0A8S9TWL9_PHYIN|nr:hypothetical protein GN958_ATG17673 [Phytophthora infestans]